MRGFLFGRWKLGEGGIEVFAMVVSEGCGCARDSATVSKGSRLDDADGNPVLLVRQTHGGVQLTDRIERRGRRCFAPSWSMFSLNDSLRYWLWSEPTDMRKSFYTLSG